MPYIPPHLRVSQDDKSRPTPQSPYARSKSSKEFIPDLDIFKSEDFINKFLVLPHPNSDHVMFARFHGVTFAHLQEFQLHILQAAATSDVEAHPNCESLTTPSKDVSCASLLSEDPARFMFETLQEDLKEGLQKCRAISHTNCKSRLKPSLWLRFGKILFTKRSCLFDWQGRYTPRELEKKLESRCGLLKTFDTCLSREDFNYFHDIANKHAIKSWSKEKFLIKLTDEMQPRRVLWCVCEPLRCNEQPTGFGLELKKVRYSPVRHMIGDVACVGKSRDIRIAVLTKEYLAWLNDDELCDIKSTFSKVSIDCNAKGGLHWPMGGKQSTSGRFEVVGSMHLVKQLVICDEMKWCLQSCNRVEFKASSGRTSYEVDVRPVIYNEFCESGEGGSLEDLTSALEHFLRYVWTNYL